MIVVDTSVWVDFFHGRATPVASTLEHLIEVQADVAITETILMEVLAGATPGEALARIRAELIARPILRLEGLADFEEAAQIYRTCRSRASCDPDNSGWRLLLDGPTEFLFHAGDFRL